MNLVLVIVALLLLVMNVFLIGKLLAKPDTGASAGSSENLPEETEVEKLDDRIAIPGYESVELIAASLEQNLCFPNPAQNN